MAATLTAVAAAAPAYRRVQDGLDRRFNRRRYEALRMARDYARRPDPGLTVEDMLEQALGHPIVQVGYWMQNRGVWATAGGEPITARDDDVVVERHARPVARIQLSGSAIEKDLASAIALEAASEFDNARLRVEAAVQLLDVQQSRQRLTRVQLAERRRIGRDLHDGAQQRIPPGTKTLAISGPATSMSDQCMALPAHTASTDASVSGIASALPGSARTSGKARRSSASIAGSGSTAVVSAPTALRVAVSLPVPARRSSTRGPSADSRAQFTAARA